MKRLLILVILVFAAWQGWKHYPNLVRRPLPHEVVIENRSGGAIERLRLDVGGQVFVRESVPAGQSTRFAFRLSRDAELELDWTASETQNEYTWRGGLVTAGPRVQRHRLVIMQDGGVLHHAEEIAAPGLVKPSPDGS
jgi:hypothetical protein